ncbi:LacI family DNA-binding transcriptional regulator [Dysgonomonas sp. Marseille-P4677]|uniref:LacI family DNA-binding transcriptional regulator n=1 Tax=Dysgonomonas sp. Marseille-P4677 TaxID=2364790 RepID=UPI001912C23D|nr:LacI family DNA-binding transcriptional regulator [Dysgonomonas sp. Marseille-P4677]MBK5719946.1 LacI family DNA-binding transcriptional regulator [Dysgonomonas sp. Marseille-P4677]
MKKGPLTIKDIARDLNISPSTVSRALKDNPDISPETRKIVQDYAKEHKYKPNALALSLRTQHTNIIGVIVPELANHFFSGVLSGMETVAEEKDYHVIVCQSSEDYQKEIRNVQTLIKARVCGVLISQSKATMKYDHFQELIDNDIPVIFFDRICTGIDSDKVVVDDYSGTFTAVEYMIKTGCKRIAFFSAPLHLEISKNRKNGYLDALRKYHIPVDESLMRIADTKQLGYEKALEILKEPNYPDAFMAMNDYTASGILLATKELGLKVPADISICGFSNSNISQDTDPMLTTMDQHPKKVGEEAMSLMLEKIENPESSSRKNRIIKTSLIVRQTTKPLIDGTII